VTLLLVALGLWLSPAVVVLVAWLRSRRKGRRALAEDIEVRSLEFAWALPSYSEGIHS
jgi:hypothetical protein